MAKASIKPHGEGACPHAPQAGRAVAPRPPPLVRLGEVCEIVSGSTPKTSVESYWGGSFPWITPAELNDKTVVVGDTARHLSEEGVASAALQPFPAGTVLLSSRAPIGKVAIAGCDMYCNQGFKNLICSDAIHNFYLYYWLKSHTSFLNSLGRGATFKEISKAIVAQIQIPLPPLPEQKRIAAILDKICEMKRNAEARLQKLDLLVKARFVEMFGDPVSNPQKWDVARIKDFADVKIGPFGSVLHKEDYVVGGHALVNPSHMVDGKIIVDESLTISDDKYSELEVYHLRIGDVVVARRGEIGRCALVQREGLICGTGSMFIRIKKRCRPDFLQRVISYPTYAARLDFGAVGVTMKNINARMIAESNIPLPPREVQDQFAAFVEKVEGLKATAKKELEQVDLLYRAKLQEFFG